MTVEKLPDFVKLTIREPDIRPGGADCRDTQRLFRRCICHGRSLLVNKAAIIPPPGKGSWHLLPPWDSFAGQGTVVGCSAETKPLAGASQFSDKLMFPGKPK